LTNAARGRSPADGIFLVVPRSDQTEKDADASRDCGFHFALAAIGRCALFRAVTRKNLCIYMRALRGMLSAVKWRDARCRFHSRDLRLLRNRTRLCSGVRTLMTPVELVLGSIMAVGLLAYLVYAMLRPEKF
jgi:K+-transporting ATPase KdpF subunit